MNLELHQISRKLKLGHKQQLGIVNIKNAAVLNKRCTKDKKSNEQSGLALLS